MIKVLIGNLFDSKCQTLVNTVNCVGVMGKGIALEFKKRFPKMFTDYKKRCEAQQVVLGRPYLYKDEEQIIQSTFFDVQAKNHWILNFPTKDHWRSTTSLDSIIRGIEYIITKYKEWGIESLAVPPLGCGEGQLEWRIVGPTLYRYLNKLDIPIEFYAPYNTPHEELQTPFLNENRNQSMPSPRWIPAAWIILVEIIKRIYDQPYHWPVGKTILQKIVYVATENDIKTKITFKKGSYGPFSDTLQKDILVHLINNGLLNEERLGKMQSFKPGRTFLDARKAYIKEIQLADKVINKIVDLFVRINTEQAEMAATVIFAAKDLKKQFGKVPTEIDVLSYVINWKKGKDQLKIKEAIRNLAILKWIEVEASPEIKLD